MASASTLTTDEISLIKGMLALRPRPTNQAIMAHFSRPGRDLNHRIIAEVRGGRWPGVTPAPELQTRLFMLAAVCRLPLSASSVLLPGGSAGRWLGTLYLDWWPVGQGLFSSGTIARPGTTPLAWLYDCGSSTAEPAMKNALDSFTAQSRAIGVASLRLAVLSHFDRDHISGFVRLLRRFPVKTLLLPYIPPWKRIVIALEEGLVPGDELWTFFVDPAAALSDDPEISVDEVLYVQAGGPDDLPDDSGPEPLFPEDTGGAAFPPDLAGDLLKPEYGDPPGEAPNEDTVASGRVAVRFLRPGGRMLAPQLWEFVPYNDANLEPKATPAFVLRAVNLSRALLDLSRTDHDRVLKLLKLHYEMRFKPSERNVISLCLYSGPVSSNLQLLQTGQDGWLGGRDWDRFSQMHTGDAFLNTAERWTAFSTFYSRGGRLPRSAFLQVMHHGSRKNWQPDLANRMNPAVSIFNSSPATHDRHPDPEVLHDFWQHDPIQVDRQGYHLSGGLCS
ncbi:MAG: hypothetical protein ACYDD1_00930 [Caulobacteraceae bacterium]